MKFSVKSLSLLVLSFLVLNTIFKRLGDLYFFETLTRFLVYKSIFKLVLALFASIILARSKLYYFNDLNKNSIVSIISIILLIALSITHVTENITIPISKHHHLFFFLSTITTGFFEEIFNRLLVFGIIYCILAEYYANNQYFKATLFSSLLFGILHLGNLFDSEYDALSVVNQAVLATGVGYLLQGILVKMKNIILVIFVHSTMNYLGSYRLLVDFNSENQSKFTDMTSIEIIINLAVFTIISALLIVVGNLILNSSTNLLTVRCLKSRGITDAKNEYAN